MDPVLRLVVTTGVDEREQVHQSAEQLDSSVADSRLPHRESYPRIYLESVADVWSGV